MAYIRLPFGAAPTVARWPELTASRLHDAAAAARRDGKARSSRKCRRRAVSTSISAPRCAPAESAEE